MKYLLGVQHVANSKPGAINEVAHSRFHATALANIQQVDVECSRWLKDYTKRFLVKLSDESDDEQGMMDRW